MDGVGNNRLQFIKFLLVGGSSAAIEYTLFIILKAGFNFDLVPAHATSFLMGAAYNFWLNKTWVFKSKGLGYPLVKYLSLLGINLVLGSFLITQLTRLMPYFISKPVTIAIIACWNFIIYKKFVFVSKVSTQP